MSSPRPLRPSRVLLALALAFAPLAAWPQEPPAPPAPAGEAASGDPPAPPEAPAGGGGGVWLFLGLLGLTAIGGVVHMVRAAEEVETDGDELLGWVDTWSAKPFERPALLEKTRGLEDPPRTLLGLFGGTTRLNVTQVTALLDLLSHFDVDPVHEKLYECAGSENDEVKKAAILAMHRLGDAAWVGVLAGYVRGEDEVARFAGATALARRGAVDQLPLLREEVARTRLGSVRDGIQEAIEKLEARAAEQAAAGG